jgi:hypothetical protein
MIAAIAAAGISGSALADVVVDIPDFSFFEDDEVYVYEVELDPGLAVNGFSFIGTVTGVSGNGTWASDTLLEITGPSGSFTSIGGFATTPENDWDFQGSQSSEDGTYESGPHFEALELDPVEPVFDSNGDGTTDLGGLWTFTFTQTFFSSSATEIAWTDVQITLIQIPAPGALALLGVAGLVGRRRRA